MEPASGELPSVGAFELEDESVLEDARGYSPISSHELIDREIGGENRLLARLIETLIDPKEHFLDVGRCEIRHSQIVVNHRFHLDEAFEWISLPVARIVSYWSHSEISCDEVLFRGRLIDKERVWDVGARKVGLARPDASEDEEGLKAFFGDFLQGIDGVEIVIVDRDAGIFEGLWGFVSEKWHTAES